MPSSTPSSGRLAVVSTLRVSRLLADVEHEIGEGAADVDGQPNVGTGCHCFVPALPNNYA